jgi:hypothetical protein
LSKNATHFAERVTKFNFNHDSDKYASWRLLFATHFDSLVVEANIKVQLAFISNSYKEKFVIKP